MRFGRFQRVAVAVQGASRGFGSHFREFQINFSGFQRYYRWFQGRSEEFQRIFSRVSTVLHPNLQGIGGFRRFRRTFDGLLGRYKGFQGIFGDFGELQ